MVCCPYLRDVPGHAGEDDHGDGHDNADNPMKRVRMMKFVVLDGAAGG